MNASHFEVLHNIVWNIDALDNPHYSSIAAQTLSVKPIQPTYTGKILQFTHTNKY